MLLATQLALLAASSLAAAGAVPALQWRVDIDDFIVANAAPAREGDGLTRAHDAHAPIYPLADKPAVETPDSEADMRKEVASTFLSQYPKNAKLEATQLNFSAIRTKSWNGDHGAYLGMQVLNVKINTCTPVITDMEILAKGVYCSKQQTCSYTRTLVATSEYEATNSFAYAATVGGGVDINVVKVELSVTETFTFAFRWLSSQSVSDSYQFTLREGQFCYPSMIHIDLECQAEAGHYEWHSWWLDRERRLTLEGNMHRKGGPYEYGQWCEAVRLRPRAITHPPYRANWQPLLADDPHRGLAWQLPATELNDMRLTGAPFAADDLVIRRDLRDNGPKEVVFRCKRFTSSIKPTTVRMPLRNRNGVLPGLIGCISGRPGDHPKWDPKDEELLEL